MIIFKRIVFFVALFFWIPPFSLKAEQKSLLKKAITSDGYQVHLYKDGTYKILAKKLHKNIVIVSRPSGAKIFLNGEDTLNIAPSRVEMNCDICEVELQMRGYKNVKKVIDRTKTTEILLLEKEDKSSVK